jgi:hypothetical protein
MTYYAFDQLSPVMQLYWVLKHGTFLAQRWDADDDGAASLYLRQKTVCARPVNHYFPKKIKYPVLRANFGKQLAAPGPNNRLPISSSLTSPKSRLLRVAVC